MTLRPLYELAGLEMHGRTFTPPHADKAGIEHVVNIANKVVQSNYIGPLIVFTTFVSSSDDALTALGAERHHMCG